MKSLLLFTSILMLTLTIASCGKKAEVEDKKKNKDYESTKEGLYVTALNQLKQSVKDNDIESFKKIVSSYPLIDLNQILHDGETFLTLTIKNDQRELRDFLIDKRVDLEQANINHETPLIAAVSGGHKDSVKVLLSHKVKLEKRKSPSHEEGDTALHIALKKGNDEIALMLIKEGANIELVDGSGHDAFTLAKAHHVPKSLELIQNILNLDFGAPDPGSFRTLLLEADHERLTVLLHRYPNLADAYETINPLAILVESTNLTNAILSAKLLLQHKANVDGPESAEKTPLIAATVTQKKAFAHLFLSHEANPHRLDKDGKSALIHAVEVNNPELVELLLSKSALEKYTYRDQSGRKISYNACRIAKDVSRGLTAPEEKKKNEKIKDELGCGFFDWFF